MTIDERTRHEMYLGLEAALGPDVADALMQHLPPVGWADVATKHDLGELEDRLELRLDALEDRLELRLDTLEDRLELRIESRIHAELNRLLLVLMPTILSSLGLAVAIGKVT